MLHREMLIAGHFVGGECDQGVGKLIVRSPYDDRVVGAAAEGGWNEANAALGAATEAFGLWSRTTRLERKELLRRIASLVRERSTELAEILVTEIGKPIVWAEGEVMRTALTFDLAADTLESWGMESLNVDYDPRGRGYGCVLRRFPLGPILAIVPYNWPFNLTAHKVAPAIAVGNTVVIKPSNQATLSTLTLARLIHEAGCPPGVVNAVVCDNKITERMAKDDRIKMVSFTGSPTVGWALKEKLPQKRVSLELGADSTAIVCAGADLDFAMDRIITSGYGYAGQVCISTQHVLVHESIYDEVRARLTKKTASCPTGDPKQRETICGPLISEAAAERVMAWIEEAVAAGATVLAGGKRLGTKVVPTLVEDVPRTVRLGCEEVFGPVMTIASYATEEEAFDRVNASEYGIQCGIFTRDMRIARRAFDRLEVGGVVIEDAPSLRFDIAPYGGVKKSGFGREGVRYAMDEMSEMKTMLMRANP